MRVVVIGGTGHIGSYLVPRLVAAEYSVANVSRARQTAYFRHASWDSVEQVTVDKEAEEAAGVFGRRVQELKPDVVIDLLCYTVASARHLVDALRGKVQLLIHCGTLWVHGHTVEAPFTEEQPRHPFGEYGIQKAAIEEYLLNEARRSGFPVTILHPGHVVGQGWEVLPNPAGHFNPNVFQRLARGEEVLLPNLGLETVHHVHADDVAQAFMQAMARRSVSIGESFHVVSPAALTLRGYAEAMARWFGREAKLRFLPWEKWKQTVSEAEAAETRDHIAHSPCASIAKAQRLLDYRPRYSSLQAVQEAVQWLIDHAGLLSDVPQPRLL